MERAIKQTDAEFSKPGVTPNCYWSMKGWIWIMLKQYYKLLPGEPEMLVGKKFQEIYLT